MTQVGFDDTPQLRVRVSGACGRARVETAVRRVLNDVLGLGIDLTGFYAVAAAGLRSMIWQIGFEA